MKLEFFWDVASPFTFLASTQIDAFADRHDLTLVYRPFLLGGVFKDTGNRPPAAVGAKAPYLYNDLKRWAARYDVPMRLPGDIVFPINSIRPMRAAYALPEDARPAYCHAVMKAYWIDGRDPSEPEVLAEVLQGMGQDAAEVGEKIGTPEVKQALREATDEAVRRGAFGAPTFFLGDEMYFGNDRFEFIANAARGRSFVEP